jgi:CBS domain-containing protein
MKVKNLMHKGIETVSPGTSVTIVAQKMKRNDDGAIPVVDNGEVIGMVTDRDVAIRGVANDKDISELTAKEIMTKGVFSCRAGSSAKEAARLMESKRVRRLPVVDSNKRIVGMLSLGDMCHASKKRQAAKLVTAVSGHHR